MRFALIALMLIGFALSNAAVVGKAVEYSADGVPLKGYLALNDKMKDKRPGILVVHEWWGLNDYTRKRAEMLAGLGYVALAVDMYGNGKTADNPGDAGKLAGETMKDMPSLKARFMAALNLLKSTEGVDTTHIAAIGYCYGGGVVLTMARAGVDLRSVVSFHAGLGSLGPVEKGNVRAKVLVCNGGADKFNSAKVIEEFKHDMTSAGADFRFISYEGALHAFTNPEATALGKKFNIPLAYNANADKKSWVAMQEFFKKTLR